MKTIKEQILELFKFKDPLTTEEISKAVFNTKQSTRSSLQKMKLDGLIYRIGIKAWSLDKNKKVAIKKSEIVDELISKCIEKYGYCKTALILDEGADKSLRIFMNNRLTLHKNKGRLDRVGDSIYVKPGAKAPKSIAHKIKSPTSTQQIITEAMIELGKVSVHDIFLRTGLSAPGITWTLNNMRKRGDIKHIDTDTYVLSSAEAYKNLPDKKKRQGPREATILAIENRELIKYRSQAAKQISTLEEELSEEKVKNARLKLIIIELRKRTTELYSEIKAKKNFIPPFPPREEKLTEEKIINISKVPNNLLPIDIKKFDFSERTLNCFKKAGILTIEQLVGYSKHDLLRISNMGTKSVGEINYILKKMNLSLKTEEIRYSSEKLFAGRPYFLDSVKKILREFGVLSREQLYAVYSGENKIMTKNAFYGRINTLSATDKIQRYNEAPDSYKPIYKYLLNGES